MIAKALALGGVQLIQAFKAEDNRGGFVKTFHSSDFESLGIDFQLDESFYSYSNKHVVRGMHFQTPPFEHAKIVYCTSGRLVDVLLDIRTDSPTFGKSIHIDFAGNDGQVLYIPVGIAHGFCTLEDATTMVYLTSKKYDPNHDAGIHYASFGFNWPIDSPLLSTRDLSFARFLDFKSPFR